MRRTVLEAAFGDLDAVIEHHHALADSLHQPHVVLDQQHGDAARRGCAAMSCHQLALLGRVHARGRLVEQEQLRVGGECARDLQSAAVGIRQRGGRDRARAAAGARRRMPAVPMPRSIGPAPLGPRAGQPEQDARRAGAGPAMHADEHVLQHAHLVEQALVLERARDAQCGDGVRRPSDQVGAAVVEGDAARRRAVEAADHVEDRGLARAVRADQPDDLAALDDQIERLRAHAARRTPSTGRGPRAAPSLPSPAGPAAYFTTIVWPPQRDYFTDGPVCPSSGCSQIVPLGP